jgi:hypothetical protein
MGNAEWGRGVAPSYWLMVIGRIGSREATGEPEARRLKARSRTTEDGSAFAQGYGATGPEGSQN